jgi:hypothetical protein
MANSRNIAKLAVALMVLVFIGLFLMVVTFDGLTRISFSRENLLPVLLHIHNHPTLGGCLIEGFVERVIRDTQLVEQLKDRIAISSLRSSNTDRAAPAGSSRCSFLRRGIARW